MRSYGVKRQNLPSTESLQEPSVKRWADNINQVIDLLSREINYAIDQTGLDHGTLEGLADNDHTQYVNAVSDTASLDMTLTGQSVKGDVLPAGVDHDSLSNVHQDVNTTASPTFVGLTTTGGRIKKTSRYTSTQAIPVTDDQVFCDGTFTVTLPVGVDGQSFRIVNTGTGVITVAVQTGAYLLGVLNDTVVLAESESIILTYETTEEWY